MRERAQFVLRSEGSLEALLKMYVDLRPELQLSLLQLLIPVDAE